MKPQLESGVAAGCLFECVRPARRRVVFRALRSLRAPAFSLIEMMIALIILGFGLLIVGAALPVGLTYNRDSGDLVLGEAAIDYGFEVIEQNVRTNDVYQPAGLYEPLIKVRPLVAGNVDATGNFVVYDYDNFENIIAAWGMYVPPYTDDLELDSTVAGVAGQLGKVSSVSRFYPPITPDTAFTTTGFFSSPYSRHEVLDKNTTPVGSETSKVSDRLVSWTAFIRRASHLIDVPVSGTSRGTDKNLYEIIIVATRRPSVNHRYPRHEYWNSTNGSPWIHPKHQKAFAGAGANKGDIGNDRYAPTPWLVTFSNHNSAQLPGPLLAAPPNPNRNLDASYVEPATLEFRASREVARLLPVGSIFIPARNDAFSDNTRYPSPDPRNTSLVGLSPHTPDSTPIYEVVERTPPSGGGANPNSLWSIKVKNPGVYPYVQSPTLDPTQWPVWVIPPAVSGGDNQLFEAKSPIIGVSRRIVRLSSPRL